MTSGQLLPIGEVAVRAGLRPSTLRFYEEAGLLDPPARVSGRRRYEPSVLSRLFVIRSLQVAGFTIQEISRLLAGGTAPRRWRPLAEIKLREIDARIAEAQRARELIELALACDCETLEGCSTLAGGYGAHRGQGSRARRKMRGTGSVSE